MLKVQEYLRNDGTISQLENDLGIKATHDSVDPLVILNYSQEDSPKSNEITKECRALTLEMDSWNLVARSFKRFFNIGEMVEEEKLFDFSNCVATDKKDGSLAVVYHYKNWRVNTRGSFAEGLCSDSGKTWSNLIFSTINKNLIEKYCIPGYSYVFEYCDIWNQQVTIYPQPISFLLTVFKGENELSIEEVDRIANLLEVARPEKYIFHSFKEAEEYVYKHGKINPTWEGVVLFDGKNRWKAKSEDYVMRHRMLNNGNGITYKSLVPWVLRGEGDEISATLPQAKERVEEINNILNSSYSHLLELWNEVKDIESQRDFALAVVPKTKFSNLLFQCRKTNRHLKDVWRDSDDLIIKVLFDK